MTTNSFTNSRFSFLLTAIFVLSASGCDSSSTESAGNIDDLTAQTAKLGGRTEVTIDLAFTDTTDDDLAKMKFHENVTSIDLRRTKVSDEGLVHLERAANLERLNLSGTRISDASVERLKAMPKLHQVDLQNSLVSKAKQSELVKHFAPRLNANIARKAAATSQRAVP